MTRVLLYEQNKIQVERMQLLYMIKKWPLLQIVDSTCIEKGYYKRSGHKKPPLFTKICNSFTYKYGKKFICVQAKLPCRCQVEITNAKKFIMTRSPSTLGTSPNIFSNMTKQSCLCSLVNFLFSWWKDNCTQPGNSKQAQRAGQTTKMLSLQQQKLL